MKAYDLINKVELDLDYNGFVDLMAVKGRQVDLILGCKKTDDDGYLTWDTEHWTSLDGRRFIRCYSLEGRQLRDSTTHNTYDLKNDFHPEQAKEININ